jgi:uncharacterized membrane protein YdjX (TVP38/TMEM64 family)
MPSRSPTWRWIAFALFALIAGTLFYISAPYLNLTSLQNHYLSIQGFKTEHLTLSILTMMLIYILAVSFSTPGAAILTILTGFLFGIPLGLTIVVFSATIGATILFTFAKWFGASWFENKKSGWIEKFQTGFQKNAWGYLFALRLIPLLPFAMINIIPGLLNIRARIFIITTLFGIIPGTFVYVSLGNGLKKIFTKGQQPNLSMIFEPHILLPLLGLALLASLPTLYKYFKGKKDA